MTDTDTQPDLDGNVKFEGNFIMNSFLFLANIAINLLLKNTDNFHVNAKSLPSFKHLTATCKFLLNTFNVTDRGAIIVYFSIDLFAIRALVIQYFESILYFMNI